MQYKLLSNDMRMPILGLGTWDMRDAECTKAVESAISIGYTHIDTAEMYKNEEAIGKAIANVDRDQLFVVSKVSPENLGYENVKRSCKASLERLNCGFLDIYLVHWPVAGADYATSFEALSQLQEEGAIRSFGVSNFDVKLLRESIKMCGDYGTEIVTNQIEFYPGNYPRDVLEFCEDHDIAVTAYSPLGEGKLLENQILKSVGSSHNKSSAQVALRWIIQKGVVAIPKSSNPQRQRENLEIFDFELSDSEMSQLDSM